MKTDISWTHVKHGSLIFPYSNCWSSTVPYTLWIPLVICFSLLWISYPIYFDALLSLKQGLCSIVLRNYQGGYKPSTSVTTLWLFQKHIGDPRNHGLPFQTWQHCLMILRGSHVKKPAEGPIIFH